MHFCTISNQYGYYTSAARKIAQNFYANLCNLLRIYGSYLGAGICARRRTQTHQQELTVMTMKNPAHPGRIIRDAIDDLELTVTDAAQMLNVSSQTLSSLLD